MTSHPQHDLAKRQMRGFGGMLSFDVATEVAALHGRYLELAKPGSNPGQIRHPP